MFSRSRMFFCWVFPIIACQAQAAPADAIEISVGIENAKRNIVPGGGLDESQSFRDCEDCPEMVAVPAGSFLMGAPSNPAANEISLPLHRVTIAKPYAIGKFTVTFAEWEACVLDAGCGGLHPSDEGWGLASRPVINVDWYDARDYLRWLSRKTGKHYRLPSEAEWEYATRAGTTTNFWWGDQASPEQGNFASGEFPLDTGTVPVKSYQPNPRGLYQVHGNVQQWMQDCSSDNYNGAPADGSAWLQKDCDYRMLRGGNWITSANTAKSYVRDSSRVRYA